MRVRGVTLVLSCCVSIAACDGAFSRATPPADDEADVRREVRVPAAASLRSLSAEPSAGGTFGREGLRIVAHFEVPPSERLRVATTLRNDGWSEGPLPDLSNLRAPPTELPNVASGLSFCAVEVYVVGQTFTRHTCSEMPEHFDRYRVGVFDPRSGELTVVLKNYY